jgi:hypothetical protein
MTLVAIALGVWLIAYTLITDKKVGMARSYSATYHKWKDAGYKWPFLVFLLGIVLGVWYVTAVGEWNGYWSRGLVWSGAVFVGGIGVAADFLKSKRMSTYHNVFSVAGFATVLIGFAINGIIFPLIGFAFTAGSLALIKKLEFRTTVVEAIGIGLATTGIFYL